MLGSKLLGRLATPKHQLEEHGGVAGCCDRGMLPCNGSMRRRMPGQQDSTAQESMSCLEGSTWNFFDQSWSE